MVWQAGAAMLVLGVVALNAAAQDEFEKVRQVLQLDQAATTTVSAAAAERDGPIITLTTDRMRARDLIGEPVYGTDGRSLGHVSDILLSHSGRVEGIVVLFGGLLGFGGKEVGIAWRDVTTDLDDGFVRISLTAEDIGRAPELVASADESG